MNETRILLAFIWVALMLAYLLGDVLRIFAGDFDSGQISGVTIPQAGWLGISVLMLIPILMILLTLVLPPGVARWANIGVAVFFFLFNLVGLPTYPGAYDKFLIVVGLAFNIFTVYTAWQWA